DERKGGTLLMRAFDRVKETWPDATLHIPAGASAEKKRRLLTVIDARWHGDVTFGIGDPDAVPRAFADAAVSVLPSLWESFGMVVLESMVCGTPVVCTPHGALPELIPDGAVGCLFDSGPLDGARASNVEGLTRALL